MNMITGENLRYFKQTRDKKTNCKHENRLNLRVSLQIRD